LANFDLFEMTFKQEEGEINEEELNARLEYMSGVDESWEMGTGVVASHFYEYSVSDFDQLSPAVLGAILSDSRLLVRDEDSVFEVVHRRASHDLSYFGLLEFVRFEFLSVECMRAALDFISGAFESLTFGIWSSLRRRLALPVIPPSQPGRFAPLPPLDSTIVSVTPTIFSVLRPKTFRLVYRGSRDGFRAIDFHNHCNGHQNTLTLISSMNDCILGGYTPLAWGSQFDYLSDPSLQSFVFTVTNPHNLSARIFRQKQGERAIGAHPDYGPTFGDGHDFYICNNCHTSDRSYSSLGNAYANDTEIAPTEVLTGGRNFTVNEIEVFDVISSR
jgi:hypothetical protein